MITVACPHPQPHIPASSARIRLNPPKSGTRQEPCPHHPVKCLVSDISSMACATQMPLAEGGTRFHFQKCSYAGAPLRNRTVAFSLPCTLPWVHCPASAPGRPLASADLDLAPACGICAPQAIAPAAEQQPVRVHAQPAAAPARAWPASQARPVGLHAGQPRPRRRSTDGQTIFPIRPPRPEDHAEQAFPYR